MPKIILDTSDAKMFEPPVEGTYLAKVDTSKAELKKGAKSTYFGIIFEITKAEDSNMVGRSIWHNVFVTGGAVGFTIKLMKALGLETPDKGEMPQIDTDDWHNLECMIEVKPDTNSPSGFKVANYWPVEGKTAKKDTSGKGRRRIS